MAPSGLGEHGQTAMKALPEKAHYSVEELAAYWSVTTRVIRHQIDKGALPAIRVGREYRVNRYEVERYGMFATT